MAARFNITADQGATFLFTFNISNDATPWNLSSYTARMQVRRSYSDANTLISVDTTNGITLDSLGNVNVSVNATTMTAVPAGRWVYDIELVSPGGEVTRIMQGRFVVSPEVTR